MRLESFTIYDAIAGLVSVVLVLNLLLLTVFRVPVPEAVVGAFGVSMGWVFRAGAGAQATSGLNPAEIAALSAYRENLKLSRLLAADMENGRPEPPTPA